MGGVLNLNSKPIIKEAKPGLDTMAIALYIVGNCSVENFCVALSGMGDLHK